MSDVGQCPQCAVALRSIYTWLGLCESSPVEATPTGHWMCRIGTRSQMLRSLWMWHTRRHPFACSVRRKKSHGMVFLRARGTGILASGPPPRWNQGMLENESTMPSFLFQEYWILKQQSIYLCLSRRLIWRIKGNIHLSFLSACQNHICLTPIDMTQKFY